MESPTHKKLDLRYLGGKLLSLAFILCTVLYALSGEKMGATESEADTSGHVDSQENTSASTPSAPAGGSR